MLTLTVLACSKIHTVYAGQNIAKFFGSEQIGAANSYLSWLDANKKGLSSVDTPLSLQQNAENYYYLYTDAPDSVKSITAGMQIHNDQHNEVNDIQITSPAMNKICNFTFDNDLWLCKVKFVANENSPIAGADLRQVYTYPTQNQTTDFYAMSQSLYIAPASEVGNITSTGPDQVPNILSAIAVSDISSQDNVPLTVKIDKANPELKSLKLNFEFADTNIANADGASTGTCEIGTITNSSGSCTINITPYKVGKTQMKFLATSNWTDIKLDFGII